MPTGVRTGNGVLNAQSFPIWLNIVLFAVAAAFVWAAGTRLARYADLISDRTALGRAFVGLVLLAAATSLPEIATTVTASAIGNTSLAVNNLFGGIVLQTAILAIADRVSGPDSLTHFIAKSALLLQGLVLIILLAITLAGVSTGGMHAPLGLGFWPALLFALYLFGLYMLKWYQSNERWKPVDMSDDEASDQASGKMREGYDDWSNRRVYLAFGTGAVVVLVAGTAIARTGDALANQTGLGGSFIGATLVALATSLPEVSTTVSAARLGAYSLAVSNVFGSNMLLPALLFPADLVDRSGSVLQTIDASARFSAAAGIVVTAIYLVGLVEHRNRTVAGVGLDSAAVVVTYLGSLVALYLLR